MWTPCFNPFIEYNRIILPHFTRVLNGQIGRNPQDDSVTAQQTTNGCALTALNPIPYARYLLLVRDKNDPQWRASGYFVSGTNWHPVYIQVDKKGHDVQAVKVKLPCPKQNSCPMW